MVGGLSLRGSRSRQGGELPPNPRHGGARESGWGRLRRDGETAVAAAPTCFQVLFPRLAEVKELLSQVSGWFSDGMSHTWPCVPGGGACTASCAAILDQSARGSALTSGHAHGSSSGPSQKHEGTPKTERIYRNMQM